MPKAEQTFTNRAILSSHQNTHKIEGADESAVTESKTTRAHLPPTDSPGRKKTKSEVRLNETIGRRLLNVREAAQYLGLEVDTVYRKSRLRELPCVKVGRALRFDVVALERYVEQHTIATID
jgi:excisionase family DNA binding protein